MSLIDGQTEWSRYRQAMEKLGEGEKDRELKREAGLCGAERALSSAWRTVNTDRQTDRAEASKLPHGKARQSAWRRLQLLN